MGRVIKFIFGRCIEKFPVTFLYFFERDLGLLCNFFAILSLCIEMKIAEFYFFQRPVYLLFFGFLIIMFIITDVFGSLNKSRTTKWQHGWGR